MYFAIRAYLYSPDIERSAIKDHEYNQIGVSDPDIKDTKDSFGDDVLSKGSEEKLNSSALELKPKLKLRKSSSKYIDFLRSYIDKYGEYTTWSLAAFQICYSCFCAPDLVTPVFFDSLIAVTASKKRLGSQASQIVRGLSKLNGYLASLPQRHPVEVISPSSSSKKHILEWIDKGESELADVLKPISPVLEKLSPGIRHDRLVCCIQHPGTSVCLYGALFTVRDVAQQVWKTYSILNGVSFLISEGRRFFSQKSSSPHLLVRIKKTIIVTIRNTLMVSFYVGLFSYLLCLLRSKYPGREYLLNYGIAGVLACPTIYIDKPGRLTELNAFVVSKVIESFIITLRHKKIVKYSRFIEMCLMAPTYGCLSIIMEKYQYALNGFTVPFFKWLFS